MAEIKLPCDSDVVYCSDSDQSGQADAARGQFKLYVKTDECKTPIILVVGCVLLSIGQ